MAYITAFFSAALITLVVMPLSRRLAGLIGSVDIPSPRKVHARPVPKCGGMAMSAGFFITTGLWAPRTPFVLSLLAGAAIIVAFGILDDTRELGYKAKFAGQIAAALVVILWGGVRIRCLGELLPAGAVLPEWAAIPLTLLVIVGVTNAINLSDGLDGLAGGVTLLSFFCVGYLAALAKDPLLALLSVATAGAIFGFLRSNTHPATVFMGDTGSLLLGFLAIVLCLALTQCNTPYSALTPLIILGFPVLDTLTVMTERVADGRSPFVADKNHLHHKLMRLGFLHGEAVMVLYVIQAFLILTAYALRFYSEWYLLAFYLVFSGAVVGLVTRADKTGWKLSSSGFFRHSVTDRLVRLRARAVFRDTPVRFLAVAAPLVLVFTACLPAAIPGDFACIACVLLSVLVLLRFRGGRAFAGGLRLVVYLTVPLAVYLSEARAPGWLAGTSLGAYNLMFGVLVVAVLVAILADPNRRFHPTPMDFLILFLALVVPLLPEQARVDHDMGLVAAKSIVLLFCFEFLMGLGKGPARGLLASAGASLLILGVKGFF